MPMGKVGKCIWQIEKKDEMTDVNNCYAYETIYGKICEIC